MGFLGPCADGNRNGWAIQATVWVDLFNGLLELQLANAFHDAGGADFGGQSPVLRAR
jgi:hypothetical protein